MIRRLVALAVLAWIFGFVWFWVSLPGPSAVETSRLAAVPTGAAGRIQHGLDILDQKQVSTLFISGVDPDVTRDEFAAQFAVDPETMECCVELGFRALDTRGNAAEIADWAVGKDARSLMLITSDWHMRRAANELERALPDNIGIVRDAVPSQFDFGTLFVEYHKYLVSALGAIVFGLVE